MKILVLNNYPLERVLKEVELGETPDQLLFGINYFIDQGHTCNLLNNSQEQLPAKYKLLQKLNWLFPLGDLFQQYAATLGLHDYDIIYCPATTQIHWLQYLRRIGKIKIPIVSISHHKMLKGRLDFARNPYYSSLYKKNDCNLALSNYVAADINQRWKPERPASSMQWGCDLPFYKHSKEVGDGIVIAGRTSRDFSTVIQALNQSKTKGTILYLKGHLSHKGEVSENITLLESDNEQPVPGKQQGWKKVKDLIPIYQSSRVIGIPLYDQDTLVGLTSLMDCLGMGKPVIMTRNPNIDLDIEKEKIGTWVEPADVMGWKNAIDWYQANPEEASQMGQRARELAETQYNTRRFANDLLDIFKRVSHEH